MVGEAGAVLRSKLGIPAATAESMTLVGNAEPPSIDVARRFGFALDALDHDDAERARDELLEVVSQAPGYAPAYRELARAWSLLGYRQKAAAAAEQAANRAAGLPPDQRLQVEAVVAAMRYDWTRAGERWAARATHVAFYVLLFAMPLTGWMMSSAKNYSVSWFGLFTWPNLIGKNEAAFNLLRSTHDALSALLFIIAVLHILAALKHHFWDRDDVLLRMLPFTRQR